MHDQLAALSFIHAVLALVGQKENATKALAVLEEDLAGVGFTGKLLRILKFCAKMTIPVISWLRFCPLIFDCLHGSKYFAHENFFR